MTTQLNQKLAQELLAVTSVGNIPDVHWLQGDGLCDCTFQRIGEWTNPYLAKTLRVRLCCIWAELYKQFPQFVQDIDGFYDENRHQWVENPYEWDGEDTPMPVPLWHRQLARKTGKPLSQVRAEYEGRESERPKSKPWHRGKRYLQPTVQEKRAAQEARLRLTGWVVGTERVPHKAGDE